MVDITFGCRWNFYTFLLNTDYYKMETKSLLLVLFFVMLHITCTRHRLMQSCMCIAKFWKFVDHTNFLTQCGNSHFTTQRCNMWFLAPNTGRLFILHNDKWKNIKTNKTDICWSLKMSRIWGTSVDCCNSDYCFISWGYI